MKKWQKQLAVLLSGALMLSTLLAGCGTKQDEAAAPEGSASITEDITAEVERVSNSYTDTEKKDKTETVYAKADASGKVKEVSVEGTLKHSGTDTITDTTNLTDIKNTSGDEEYTNHGDGVIVWENHGEDISYKGTSTENLPVSVAVTYKLNGRTIEPEDLIGQSGRVTIRFDYENLTSETVLVNGKSYEVPVPFAVFSAMVMPEEHFYNVKVSNGKTISMNDQNIVIGYACPGLQESLKLSDDLDDTVDIPNYVEISANTENFELEFTATVISNGLFSEMNLNDLDDIDEFIDSMSELSDASGALTDGTSELTDGISTLCGYLNQYTTSIGSLDEGAAALTAGLQTLNSQKDKLISGANTMESGLDAINKALEDVSIPSVGKDDDSKAIADAAEVLEKDASQLKEQLAALQDTIEQAQSIAEDAQSYQEAVSKAVSNAKSELEAADLSGITSTAKQQAREAALQALSGTELTEEQKQQAAASIADSVDVSGVVSDAQQHMDAANHALNELPEWKVESISVDTDKISGVISDMQKQLEVLYGYAQTLRSVTKDLSGAGDTLQELKKSLQQLQQGSAALTSGITAFNEGIGQLYEGAAALSGGTSQLYAAGKEITSGTGALLEGSEALRDGMYEFDKEGIQTLENMANDNIRGLMNRLKALKKADQKYTNFSGLQDGQTGSVKFIIETEEMKKE